MFNRKAQIEKQNDLITRAEKLVNTAESEKRELTEDEAAELAEIRDDIQRIKKFLDIQDEIDDARPTKSVEGDVKEAKNVIDGEDARACGDKQERAIEDAETKAFENYLRGRVIHERAGELAPANNGAVIPKTIAKKIIEHVYEICPILAKSDKYTIKGDLELPYYDNVTSGTGTPLTCAYQSEFVAMSSTTGNFTTISLGGFLAGALCKVSRSLINNVDFDIVGFVVKEMGIAIARFIEHELINGTSGKITGLSNSTNTKTAAAANAITSNELIELQAQVPDVYQANACWIMAPATRTAIRELKDQYGRYMLQDDISLPFGKSLLGKPVFISDNMPAMATGNMAVVYGDLNGLAVKFSEDINIQVLREKYADEHAVGVIGWLELDAKIADQQKIATLKMA
jgi:HK97 family phage major capsid protein